MPDNQKKTELVWESWERLKLKIQPFDQARLGDILISLGWRSLKRVADWEELELAIEKYKERKEGEIELNKQAISTLYEQLENKPCRYPWCENCEYCKNGPEIEEVD